MQDLWSLLQWDSWHTVLRPQHTGRWGLPNAGADSRKGKHSRCCSGIRSQHKHNLQVDRSCRQTLQRGEWLLFEEPSSRSRADRWDLVIYKKRRKTSVSTIRKSMVIFIAWLQLNLIRDFFWAIVREKELQKIASDCSATSKDVAQSIHPFPYSHPTTGTLSKKGFSTSMASLRRHPIVVSGESQIRFSSPTLTWSTQGSAKKERMGGS